MNSNTLHGLLTERTGRVHAATSLDRDPERGGTWLGLRPAPVKRKRVLLEPDETHTMAAPSGSGLITRLFMTTLLPFNRTALRDLVLRFYWDGEAHPSVECPLGDFFGAPFGSFKPYVSSPMSLTSGAFNCLWHMPFHAGARLTVTNEGSTVVDPLFYHVTYHELAAPPPTGLRFHAQWRRENPTREDHPYTILDVRGKGHYVGCHLFMQNLEWWLRLPLSGIIFPYGAGMGMLEGWESILVDGEKTPSIRGTGTEDYFGGAWYYGQGGTFAAPDHGCTVRDYVRGRIAAYRFDLEAPLHFENELQVRIDHGFENRIRTDYASVAYWYQDEPHAPFLPLPPAAARRPASGLANVVQAALLVGIPLLAVLGLWHWVRVR